MTTATAVPDRMAKPTGWTGVDNWDKDLQEDRTCTHHDCGEFGTHRVLTDVYGEDDLIEEWMCSQHSLDYVVLLRTTCNDDALASRCEVAR